MVDRNVTVKSPIGIYFPYCGRPGSGSERYHEDRREAFGTGAGDLIPCDADAFFPQGVNNVRIESPFRHPILPSFNVPGTGRGSRPVDR
jgi:hypothetical protein